MKWLKLALIPILVMQLSGCGVWKTVKKITTREKKVYPKMLVIPFSCSNGKIAGDILKGFTENIDKKIEVLDLDKFRVLLASHPTNLGQYFSEGLSVGTQTAPGVLNLSKDLFRKEDLRKRFYLETGIQYFVAGNAKEKPLTDLEFGNLVTAETAQVKVLELASGKVIVEEDFKQGLFEIVAPERIGSKFASRVNRKLSQLQKQTKRRQKEIKKGLISPEE